MWGRKLFNLLFISLFLISLVSAINVEIEKKPIKDIVISGIDKPAEFVFSITNLEQTDNFELYTLVGVDLTPKGTFVISSGQTKTVQVDAYIPEKYKQKPGFYTFNYKLRGQNTGIHEDTLTVKIADFQESFEISSSNIYPGADKITVDVQNKENFHFNSIYLDFNSVFFEYSETIELEPYEKKEIQIDINPSKSKNLVAGKYILVADISSGETKTTKESTINFLEFSEISSIQNQGGFFIKEEFIEKTNNGNLPSIAETRVRKDVISRLFTTFTIHPDKSERKGFYIYYTWSRELRPAETFRVTIRTNWVYPFLILVFLVIMVIILRLAVKRDVEIKKRVSYVKTKGGEFALKVSLKLKAKKYVENIRIIDKIPAVAKIYERYGLVSPDKVDEKNKRIEWNLESLNAGEERLLTYIIYSKIRVVGKFSLPLARVIYERNGKIYEIDSNRVFFITEPRKPKKPEHE
jgi:hypothetical protein